MSKNYYNQIKKHASTKELSIISAVNAVFKGTKMIKYLEGINANYSVVSSVKDAADKELCKKLKSIIGQENPKKVILVSNDKNLVKEFNTITTQNQVGLKLLYSKKEISSEVVVDDKVLIAMGQHNPMFSKPRKVKSKKIDPENISTPYDRIISNEKKMEIARMHSYASKYLEDDFFTKMRVTGLMEHKYSELSFLDYMLYNQYEVVGSRYLSRKNESFPYLKMESNVYVDINTIIAETDPDRNNEDKIKYSIKKKLIAGLNRMTNFKSQKNIKQGTRTVLVINYAEYEDAHFSYENFRQYLIGLLYTEDEDGNSLFSEKREVTAVIIMSESLVKSRLSDGYNMEMLHNPSPMRMLGKKFFKRGVDYFNYVGWLEQDSSVIYKEALDYQI